jgi:hypothetical protein
MCPDQSFLNISSYYNKKKIINHQILKRKHFFDVDNTTTTSRIFTEMLVTAFVLILSSALVHASWNLAARKVKVTKLTL